MAVPIDFALIPGSTSELSVSNIQDNVRLLNALWGSSDKTIDVTHGAFAALVVNPAATLLEGGKQAFATARKSSSFTALAQNNLDATSLLMLDELAKSYCVQRREGKRASGVVRVVYSSPVQTTIGSGTIFEARGYRFTVSRPVTAVAASNSLLIQTGASSFRKLDTNSNYVYFDIEVAALSNGAGGNLVKGTEFAAVNVVPAYFLYAFVLETFTGGEDDESNTELVQRMQLGISAKVLSSRTNMRAALLEMFPDIRDSAVIGAGDIEMTRDKRTAFPLSVGGFSDWYIGTSRQLLTMRFTTESFIKLEEGTDGTSLYSVHIGNAEIPCMYAVISLEDAETGELCELVSEERYIDQNTSTVSNVPLIRSGEYPADGFYTVYQAANIRFRASSELKRVIIAAYYAGGLAEIQDWVLRCDLAPLGLDILVKAAIPTIIQFSCVLNIPVGVLVDHAGLQGLVANYINRLPFNGLLAISGLTALLHDSVPSNCFISKPALFATTLLPDGTRGVTQAEDVLTLSYLPYATNRTSLFFCDPVDVSFETRYIETDFCR
jgi:hypothetical protein